MRLTSIVLIIGMSLSFLHTQAQIRVHNNDHVQVGPFWGGTPGENLFVNGTAHFNCHPAQFGGFIFENYPNGTFNEPIIRPTTGHNMWLGNSNAPLWRVYSHRLYTFQGAGILSYNSDSTLKENVRPIVSEQALQIILDLQSYAFDFKPSFFAQAPAHKRAQMIEEGQDQRGLIAQEVMTIYPQAVRFDESTGLYNIDYSSFVPMLIEAVKAQQAEIELLKQRLEALE